MPIIVDLDGDGVEISFGQQTYFDWDDDGFLEQGSWASADDGFLVLDLNADGSRGVGDGVIDQTRELVWSLWGSEGDTDLQALRRAFDDNGDGLLNDLDAVWNELRIWQDLDQDGETDDGELRTLADWGITQINLGYDDGSDYSDTDDDINVFGNTLHGLASFLHDGSGIDIDDDAVADGYGNYTATGGVGDVSLSFNTQGWRRVETATGYTIEFESGQTYRYAELDGTGSADLNLAIENIDGATGDDRANDLSAAGFARSVQIAGGDGDDLITGGDLDDMLSGDNGQDTIDGGAGNDLIFFDVNDEINGGTGYDTAVFSGVGTLGVTLYLNEKSIEAVIGSDHRDAFSAADGNTAVNISGLGGDDLITGSHENDTLAGGDGDDALFGKNGADFLIGGEGFDTLLGESGDDYLVGGAGNDLLEGDGGDDDLLGGEGADRLIGGHGDDYLVGGSGADHLLGGAGDDVLISGEGNDLVIDYGGVNWIEAGDGDDTIRLGDQVNAGGYAVTYGNVLGGAGHDVIELRGVAADWTLQKYSADGSNSQWVITSNEAVADNKPLRFDVHDIERVVFLGDGTEITLAGADSSTDSSSTFVRYQDVYQFNWLADNWSMEPPATGGHEPVFGSHGAGAVALGNANNSTTGSIGTDAVDGGAGNDTLRGGDGSDILVGGSGADDLDGDAGSDSLWGGVGNDSIEGGSGSDWAIGGDGNDTIHGGTGADYLYGSDGADSLNGGWDRDVLYGGAGADTLYGERGDDQLYGNDGDDSLNGYTGNDQLVGGAGNDYLAGSIGFDALSGGAGNDTLLGGTEDDWLIGGDGIDQLFGGNG
ncbi:MAG: calcium-binding protein, partial [Tateyamaria sp.]